VASDGLTRHAVLTTPVTAFRWEGRVLLRGSGPLRQRSRRRTRRGTASAVRWMTRRKPSWAVLCSASGQAWTENAIGLGMPRTRERAGIAHAAACGTVSPPTPSPTAFPTPRLLSCWGIRARPRSTGTTPTWGAGAGVAGRLEAGEVRRRPAFTDTTHRTPLRAAGPGSGREGMNPASPSGGDSSLPPSPWPSC
jgi:hypothetical protein